MRYIILLIIFSLFSCNSQDVITNDISTGVDNIKHNLEKEKINLIEAYELTNDYYNRDIDDKTEIEKYREILEKSMYDHAVFLKDNKDYKKAIAYFKSLDSIDYQYEIDLIKECYNELLKDENISIFYRRQIKEEMANRKLLSLEEVKNILEDYYRDKSVGFYNYLLEHYKDIYPDLLNKYPQLEDYKNLLKKQVTLNLEEKRNAVVTVIMDKGMKFERGMGIQDKAIGSGFFIDNDGHILTNYHVISPMVDPEYEGFARLTVTTKDDYDTEIKAEVIGYDKVFDIALIKINKKNTPYLTLGRSLDMHVGDKIYTIGNPIGIQYTVTSGIISNMDIDFFQMGQAIQVDAAINPGNSGGPLIDEIGQVIGIVFSGVPQFEGISFAIPFQWVRKTIPMLYQKGEVQRAWTGAGLLEQNDELLVYYILPNGSAEKAGLKYGDKIKAINDIKVETLNDVQSHIAWREPESLVKITVERDGENIDIITGLTERPFLPVKTAFEKDTEKNLIKLVFGIELEMFSKGMIQNKYRVVKTFKGMPGSKLDLITSDPVTVYMMKYMDDKKIVALTIQFHKKHASMTERVMTLSSYAEINTIF